MVIYPNNKMILYPEIEKAGGLLKALNNEFEKINSTLKVEEEDDMDNFPFSYARIENSNKFTQVYIGAEKKIYLPDFWKEGVCLAHGQTESITELVKVLDYWLCNDIKTKELVEKFEFVSASEKADVFDEGNEVEYTWNYILEDKTRVELKEFVKIAIKDEVLNKLFPFTSLYTLCFSRCTGYPYNSEDLPEVTPKQYQQFATRKSVIGEVGNLQEGELLFVVTKNREEYLGEGSPLEALKLVKNNLPKDIKPSIKGINNA